MSRVKIDVEKRKLLILCDNRHEIEICLRLPARRWMPKLRGFIVPFTRLNAVALLEAQDKRVLGLGDEATKVLEGIAHKVISDRKFPNWYSHKQQPRIDQRNALEKLYKHDNIALYMKMGSGKSKVYIDYMTGNFYERAIEAVVLICPFTVKSVWDGPEGELAKHSPAPYEVVDVDSSFDATRYRPSQDRVLWLLVGIESLSQGKTYERLLPFLQAYKCGVVVDEATRIKNHKTTRTERVIAMGRIAQRRAMGTGITITRNFMDIYAQFEFMDPTIIGVGDYYAFRNRYAVMGGYKNKEIVGYDNVEELMSIIEPYTYICEKPEGLPPQVFLDRFVDLHPSQRELYNKIRKGKLERVDVKNILTRVLRLQQVVGGFYNEDGEAYYDEAKERMAKKRGKLIKFLKPEDNPKILALDDILQDTDQQVIIWARFLEELDDIKKVVADHGTFGVLTGETARPDRTRLKDDFQSGKLRFLIGNAATGGTGLTLTAATLMIFYSNTFSLDDRMQAEDRMHRIGQDADSVTYIDIMANKTVDLDVVQSNKDKRDVEQYFRDKLRAAGGDVSKIFQEA